MGKSVGAASKPAVVPTAKPRPGEAEQTAKQLANGTGADGEAFVAVDDYTKEDDTGLSLKRGDTVLVRDKAESGWWYATHATSRAEGWVPSTFLKPAPAPVAAKPAVTKPAVSTTPVVSSPSPAAPAAATAVPVAAKPTPAAVKSNSVSVPNGSKIAMVPVLPKADAPAPAPKPAASAAASPPASSGAAGDGAVSKPALVPRKPTMQSGPSGPSSADSRKASTSAVPAPRPAARPAAKDNTWLAVDDYVCEDSEGFSFRKGDSIEVVERSETGWWFARCAGKEGWIPSTFLKEKT